MNASDIVTRKQQTTLYKAYYQPTVFQSTSFSTLQTISSIIRMVSSGIPLTSTSYASTIYTVPLQTCEPTFMTYQTRHDIHQASCPPSRPCALFHPDYTPKATVSTTLYSYSTIYSTLVAPSTLYPSTIRIQSTTVLAAPPPHPCPPSIQYQQGPSGQ
jgi:hypothetical protein